MKVLHKISNALDRICGDVIVFMLCAMVIITTAQIICRTWFTALSWSDEVTRYLLIWSTFLGATCVYLHGGNIAITFIQEAFPDKVSRFLRILVQAICLVLFVVLCYYGIQYDLNLKKTATSIPIKMSYVFIVVPISMGICAFQALVLMLDEIFGKPDADKKEVTG